MDKYARFLACMILGLAWCAFVGVDCTVRRPALSSIFARGLAEGASSSRFVQGPGPQNRGKPPPFRILPTILNIKNGRVTLNYGYNAKLRSRIPSPSSYSTSDWIPIPRKPGPPSLPTSYGPKHHHPPPPKGWQPPPPKGWAPPAKGWAPKKKHVVYVLLKEPNVKTNVQVVEDGQKNEPEVILQYEGFNNAQAHYEISKPTPTQAVQLLEGPVLAPEPVPIPLPLPVSSPQPQPSPLPSPSPEPFTGGYIIQQQYQPQLQVQQQQQVLEQPVAVAVNNGAHNILNGYSGYSLNSLNTNGLPISLVYKRTPEVQLAQAEPAAAAAVADSIGNTNERVEVSVSSVTKQVSST